MMFHFRLCLFMFVFLCHVSLVLCLYYWMSFFSYEYKYQAGRINMSDVTFFATTCVLKIYFGSIVTMLL